MVSGSLDRVPSRSSLIEPWRHESRGNHAGRGVATTNLKSSMLDRVCHCHRHCSLKVTLLLIGNDSGKPGTTTKSLLLLKRRTKTFVQLPSSLVSDKTLWKSTTDSLLDDEEQRRDIDFILYKLGEFCVGTTNKIYERYLFNKRDQAVGESIDGYVASLRSLAKTCYYGALTDNLISDRMVVGILDKGIRKKLLQDTTLNLQSCIYICRATECTKQQLQAMDQSEEVHSVDKRKSKGDFCNY